MGWFDAFFKKPKESDARKEFAELMAKADDAFILINGPKPTTINTPAEVEWLQELKLYGGVDDTTKFREEAEDLFIKYGLGPGIVYIRDGVKTAAFPFAEFQKSGFKRSKFSTLNAYPNYFVAKYQANAIMYEGACIPADKLHPLVPPAATKLLTKNCGDKQ